MSELSEIQQAVLVEGLDDWVGLWTVAREVREGGGRASEVVRQQVVDLIRQLNEAGYVRVGHPTSEGTFRAWKLSPAEAAERIGEEWSALGRDPDIGEICWLENTELGDEVARQVGRPKR